MECLSDSHPSRRIVLMFAAQTSKTEIGLNWLGYIIDHAPAPTLVVVPTLEVRKRWVKQRLNPMLSETSVLSDVFDAKRTRDSGNSEDVKDFPGGVMMIGGANSPASLASIPVKNVLCDEIDRFPWEVASEGDPLGLIDERTKTFPRRKLLLVSTPTVKGSSRIESEYNESDQRRYYVPCPHCEHFQILEWKNFKWISSGESIEDVHYSCEECGKGIDESYKTWMLKHGKWVAKYPEREIRGYAISGLYSPPGLGFSWKEIVNQWLKAQSDVTKLKRFINTTLGETWEDQSTRIESHDLQRRVELRAQREIPDGCLALTCGIDTQDNWLEVILLGWGNCRLWVIERYQIIGDTTRDEVWDKLEQYINTPLVNQYKRSMRIDAAAIDIRGHRGEQVRRFCQRGTVLIPIFAVQGATTRMSKAISPTPSYPEKTLKGHVIRGGFAIWNIGTEYCKDYIFSTLASDEKLAPDDRVMRFPQGLSDDYFDGLLSEVYDPEKHKYIKKKGAKYQRNEPLDTLVYAWAIGQHKQIRIGMTVRGEPSPIYWERRRADLESAQMLSLFDDENNVHVVEQKTLTQTGKISLDSWARG